MKKDYKDLKQINKTVARKMYENGECVYVIQCNASRNFGEFKKDGKIVQRGVFWSSFEKEYTPDADFDTLVNEYMFCAPKELGSYLNYYTKK